MKMIFGLLMVVFLAGSIFSVAYAERYVVVNGQRLSIPEIQYVERLHCGPIPNGRYWINLETGIWGYEGNPRPQGHIADNCRGPHDDPACPSGACCLARTIGSDSSTFLFLPAYAWGVVVSWLPMAPLPYSV